MTAARRRIQKPLSSSRRMPARRQEQGATRSTVCSLLANLASPTAVGRGHNLASPTAVGRGHQRSSSYLREGGSSTRTVRCTPAEESRSRSTCPRATGAAQSGSPAGVSEHFCFHRRGACWARRIGQMDPASATVARSGKGDSLGAATSNAVEIAQERSSEPDCWRASTAEASVEPSSRSAALSRVRSGGRRVRGFRRRRSTSAAGRERTCRNWGLCTF